MEQKKERLRKEYAKGGSSQKMMAFRADADVVEILSKVANKGRLINDLVKRWAVGRWAASPNQLADPDAPPEENDTHDYEP